MIRNKKIERFIDLTNVPIYNDGANKGKYNWEDCNGIFLTGNYDGGDFKIFVSGKDEATKKMRIIYNDKEHLIRINNLSKCQIGGIFREERQIKVDFKYKIGQRLIDYNENGSIKRDVTIIDRKYTVEIDKNNWNKTLKFYKYRCNKCEFDCSKHWSIRENKYKEELWIKEFDLKEGRNCSCCEGNQIVVENINSIYHTDKWMIPYLGEECAKIHTYGSSDKVDVICQDCGRLKNNVAINYIYKTHSIGCTCSDNISYPEKTMYSVLEQLNIEFKTQLSKKDFKWCNKYKYDFCFELNNEQYIIETHGLQHYKKSTTNNWKPLEEEQENDRIKKELALSNGIKEENYIVIDCRYSTLEFIKQNILESRLNELFDLSIIDWNKCEEFALSNRVKEACDLWTSGIHSTKEIASIMRLSIPTIRNYLKRGKIILWCDYDSKEEKRQNKFIIGAKISKANGKQVQIFKEGISLGIFESMLELEKESKKLFGVELNHTCISKVCKGKRKQHKGFTFKYFNKIN